jgi:WD40 repeat protein
MIHSLDFSPNGDFLAIVSRNGTIHFFELKGKAPSKTVQTFNSFLKVSISQPWVSSLMWSDPGLVCVMMMDGQMLNVAVDERGCREVGREQILVVKRIRERLNEGLK